MRPKKPPHRYARAAVPKPTSLTALAVDLDPTRLDRLGFRQRELEHTLRQLGADGLAVEAMVELELEPVVDGGRLAVDGGPFRRRRPRASRDDRERFAVDVRLDVGAIHSRHISREGERVGIFDDGIADSSAEPSAA